LHETIKSKGRAEQKYRPTETARNPGSVATGRTLGIATWDACGGGQSAATALNMKAAQHRCRGLREQFRPQASTTSGAP